MRRDARTGMEVENKNEDARRALYAKENKFSVQWFHERVASNIRKLKM